MRGVAPECLYRAESYAASDFSFGAEETGDKDVQVAERAQEGACRTRPPPAWGSVWQVGPR